MANKTGNNGQNPKYEPTPEQIKAECDKIRSERINHNMMGIENPSRKEYSPTIYKHPRVR